MIDQGTIPATERLWQRWHKFLTIMSSYPANRTDAIREYETAISFADSCTPVYRPPQDLYQAMQQELAALQKSNSGPIR
jgi:hypothetical protein